MHIKCLRYLEKYEENKRKRYAVSDSRTDRFNIHSVSFTPNSKRINHNDKKVQKLN